MNAFFYAVVEVLILLTSIEASPRRKWNYNSKHPWHHSDAGADGCLQGQCAQVWKCPEGAISEEPTGHCVHQTNGPWVCCVLVNDASLNHPKEFNKDYEKTTYKPPRASSEFVSKMTPAGWKRKNNDRKLLATESYWHNEMSNNEPCIEDSLHRNVRPISSLGDVPIHSWDYSHTSRSWYMPTRSPHTEVWKKTTANMWSKSTSKPLHAITTRNKPSSSESRIIFPTESGFSTKRTTKRPSPTTRIWEKVTKRPLSGSESWDKTTKRRTSTTQSWGKTTNAVTHTPTKPSWAQPTRTLTTSTKAYWGAATPVPGRPTYKTTQSKPTKSTRVTNEVWTNSEERRNHGSGKSTTSRPVRQSTTPSSNSDTRRNRVSTTKSSTTRRNVNTTPLPNVNTHLCGIRVQRPTSRRARSYKEEADLVTSDLKTLKSRQPFQRIVGGTEVEPFSWPWVAALYKVTSGGNRFLSAGSLINEHFILTAAHVFTPDDLRTASYVVMLGTHNAEDAVAAYRVTSVLQHPRYEPRYYYHDIALLKLERPVTFNDLVMPVCLPSPKAPLLQDKDLEGKNVTVMGWGDDSFGGKSSPVLREATFPVASRRFCNASYVRVASNRFPRGITENMLCAGDPNGGKDACQGDSGGPLTSVVRGRHIQVGIVSFGYQCGDKDFPGVYTKVAPYISWIAEKTQSAFDYNYDDYDYRG